MTGITPFRTHSRDNPIGQPNLRLVTSNPIDPATTPASGQSLKMAVMACLTARSSGNSELLRKASAAAREHAGEFYAVLLESPRTRFGKVQVRPLIDDAILASYLGARIVWLDSPDVVGELLQLAKQSGVGRIFVARNRPAPFSRLFWRTVYSDLLNRAEGFHIHVVGFERGN